MSFNCAMCIILTTIELNKYSIQLGVPAGSYFSQMIRHKTPNADPIVCAVTLLCSVPVLFFGFVSANYSISLCYGLTFLAG